MISKFYVFLFPFLIPFFLHSATIKTNNDVYDNAHFEPSNNTGFVTIVQPDNEYQVKIEDIKPFKLTMKTGKTYEGVKIDKLTGTYVNIYHDGGMGKIKLDDLSIESRSFFLLKSNEDAKIVEKEMAAATLFLQKLQNAKTRYTIPASESSEISPAYSSIPANEKTKQLPNKKAEKGMYTAVFVVEGDYVRGTCFFVNLFGEKVLISNAHVMVPNKNIKIRDNSNREVEIKGILVAKTLDMVIIDAQVPDDIKPLELDYNVSSVVADNSIYALGNSLGEQIIVHSRGKVLGVGPTRIEIDADIVPGNSGGPVILTDSQKVVGVSSYLKMMNNTEWSTIGTRFKSEDLIVIRRFALRIDTISLNDFEPVSPFLLKKDMKCYREIDMSLTRVFDPSAKDDLIPRANLFHDIVGKYKNYKWSNSYLDHWYDDLENLANKLEPYLEKIKNREKVASQKSAGNKERCGKCVNGVINVKVVNPEYGGKRLVPKYITEPKSCDKCNGTGYIDI